MVSTGKSNRESLGNSSSRKWHAILMLLRASEKLLNFKAKKKIVLCKLEKNFIITYSNQLEGDFFYFLNILIDYILINYVKNSN